MSLPRAIEIGPGRWAHASGALWLPASHTVLIADAHLGFGWAQRRRGELGPLVDEIMRARIAAVLSALSPERVVLLGDIVHAPKPAPAERELIAKTLEAIAARAQLVLVRGNHDRGFASDFAGTLVERWETRGLVAVHGDALPTRVTRRHIVAGHWHPAFNLRDAAGVPHRVPVFASSPGLTVLPAFSALSAGINLRRGIPAEWRERTRGRMTLYAATGTMIKELGSRPAGPADAAE